jgi:hypothetical protein
VRCLSENIERPLNIWAQGLRALKAAQLMHEEVSPCSLLVLNYVLLVWKLLIVVFLLCISQTCLQGISIISGTGAAICTVATIVTP